jgi:putative OPT family oligopeptide transporter
MQKGKSEYSSFKPFIPAAKVIPEFTFRAVLIGAIFGLIFSAVTVYLGLRVGLTVSVAIPIAVMAMALFKFMEKAFKRKKVTILEMNTVQTTGAAGESIAAGIIFTMPAMVFLGFSLKFTSIFVVALAGGLLGTLFLIVLRSYLIEKEHGKLLYPEGIACADILIAGEKGGKLASYVFLGTIFGFIYKILNGLLFFWKERPFTHFKFYPGSFFNMEVSPELLGVGYLIGIRTAAIMIAGGFLSWMILIPIVAFFGNNLPLSLTSYPDIHTVGGLLDKLPIEEATSVIYKNYIKFIGAGAVVAGGFINLGRAMPTIIKSFKAGIASMKKKTSGTAVAISRTSKDLPFSLVGIGTAVMFIVLWFLLNFIINPGHPFANIISALLIIIFGFFFATVSARLVGEIGVSSNPTSGMTIATLMGTCLIFLAVGWTGGTWSAVALSIGAVVAITASNAGNVAQSLKTGHLLGCTPYKQEYGYIIGAVSSILIVGATVLLVNSSYTSYKDLSADSLKMRVTQEMTIENEKQIDGITYLIVNPNDSSMPPNSRYLANKETGVIERQMEYGIGSKDLPAPQATIMATLIKGLLERKLPWVLVLFGICITITVELCGVKGLPFAVGLYLPISTTVPIFAGGLTRWIVDKKFKKPVQGEDPEASPGMLFSSGLIAGGAIAGLLIAIFTGLNLSETLGKIGPSILGTLTENNLFGVVIFFFMTAALFYMAIHKRKK